jgi:hypothetical protein
MAHLRHSEASAVEGPWFVRWQALQFLNGLGVDKGTGLTRVLGVRRLPGVPSPLLGLLWAFTMWLVGRA